MIKQYDIIIGKVADDKVFRVDNFINQVLNYEMPYILFYQKNHNNNYSIK